MRLEQALGNMVDNALRYGTGRVALVARKRPATVALHVTDQGSGFPSDYIETAFERFTRADPARGRGGAGLGPAIVEAHDGAVGAVNRQEGGADVWLTVPDGLSGHWPS